ncbi:hypothetical protein ACV229_16785 [Burkholderia sp. MR1-5-21]
MFATTATRTGPRRKTCGLRAANAARVLKRQFCRCNLPTPSLYDFPMMRGRPGRRVRRRFRRARSKSCCAAGPKRSNRIVEAARIAITRILAMLKWFRSAHRRIRHQRADAAGTVDKKAAGSLDQPSHSQE